MYVSDKVVTSEGAKSSKYNVKYHNIGRYIPKCSMGLRPKGACGYPHNQDIGELFAQLGHWGVTHTITTLMRYLHNQDIGEFSAHLGHW